MILSILVPALIFCAGLALGLYAGAALEETRREAENADFLGRGRK